MKNIEPRHLLAFALFTLAHFVASIGSLFFGGGFVMAAFDGNGSDTLANLAATTISVLFFPIVNGLSNVVPVLPQLGTIGEYAMILLNSMLWAGVAILLWSRWKRHRARLAGA